MPWRRLRMISSRCCSSGRPFTSTTLSSMRVKTFTTCAVLVPVEVRVVRERVAHEAGQVDRTEQARAVRRQRLLAARVGGADVLAPPVVVHLVDAVDEHEAGLGEVVGGRHDHVPHALRRQGLVDLAQHQAFVVAHVAVAGRPFAPDELRRVGGVVAFRLDRRDREGELPVAVLAHRLHELVGDEQRQVELPEAPGLALGADELHRVRVADVEGAHLRAAAAAGRRHREAHLVVDIHERQRARGVGAGTRHVGAARAQRRELVADAAAGLERQARLVDLAQDVVHRVADGARHRAVDRRGRRLVLLRARVRGDAARRDRAATQRPDELLVPVLAHLFPLDVGQRAGDTLVGVVHGVVDRRAVLGGQAVLLVPDVERRFLEGDAAGIPGLNLHGSAHCGDAAPVSSSYAAERDNPPFRRGTDPARVRCDSRLTAAADRLGRFQKSPGNPSCRTQHVGSGREL